MRFPVKTISLAVASALIVFGCGKEAPPPPPPKAEQPAAPPPKPTLTVKIGHSAPLTGPQAHLGKDNENGARLAIEEANAKKMEIGGAVVTFEMIAEDDQADPKQGTTVAQKLIDAKVSGVVGHLNSGTTIPASKLYADAGIPQISPSATNPKYTQQGFKTAYRVMANDEQQGKVLGDYATKQLSGKKIAEVRITYVGELANLDASPVTMAVLKGLLTPMVGENVNYVNASLIAAERGLRVVEAKATQAEEFTNLLSLEVRSNGASAVFAGTLSARREPRIVQIDQTFIEASPEGHMLVIKNEDKPGLIGALGTLLAEAKINIAGMSNGRDRPGGTAITVVNVDSPVPAEVLERVRRLKNVLDVTHVKL